MAVLLLIALQVGDAVGKASAVGLEMHTFGGYHAQLEFRDDTERSQRYLRCFKYIGIAFGRTL